MGVEGPIFRRQKIDFKSQDEITDFAVADQKAFIISRSRHLSRIDIHADNDSKGIDIVRSDGKVLDFWPDQKGEAAIFSVLQNGMPCSLLWTSSSNRVKQIKELKNMSITAASWISSSRLIAGNSNGEIFSFSIDSSDWSFKGGSMGTTVKVHFESDEKTPITGISSFTFETQPGNKSFSSSARRVVLATTSSNLIHFIGTDAVESLDQVFSGYTAGVNVINFPANGTFESKLVVTPMPNENDSRLFAWTCMSGQEVFVGEVNSSADRNRTITNNKIITGHGQTGPIHGLALTRFHVVTLHSTCIAATCLLNNQLVFVDHFEKKEALRGLVMSNYDVSPWAFSSQSPYIFRIKNEGRSVWRIYLDLGEFNEAKKFCKDDKSVQNEIMVAQAEHLLNGQKKSPASYREAAMIYAKTEEVTSEIALKFLPSGSLTIQENSMRQEALIYFLKHRLPLVKSMSEKGFIIGWLLELYLTSLRDTEDLYGAGAEEVKHHRQNFLSFVNDPSTRPTILSMKETLYSLLRQHGAVSDFQEIASLIGDHEAIISNSLQNQDWPVAVKTLEKCNDPRLFYKFSSSLLPHVPQKLCSAWESCQLIDPEELLEVMASSSTRSVTCRAAVLQYIESRDMKTLSKEIHNLHLSLLCSVDIEKAESYIVKTLENDEKLKCDLSFAFKCLESFSKNCTPMCYLITQSGRWEDAVKLALANSNGKLAKKLAHKAKDSAAAPNSSLKSIWMHIAEAEISKDPSSTGDILKESDGLVNVGDVLQFFPEFATIDHFKQALCSSLVSVSAQIDEYQDKLQQTQNSARQIRKDIKDLNRKCYILTSENLCTCCYLPILSSAFLVFHCGHYFHTACAVKELIFATNSKKTATELKTLLQELNTSSTSPVTRQKIERLVADECPFCGIRAVESIDVPLLNSNTIEDW